MRIFARHKPYARDVAYNCRKTKRMKKENLPLIIIIVSIILIGLNFIFTSDEMDVGFWLRVTSSIFLIVAMVITIRERKKNKNKSD